MKNKIESQYSYYVVNISTDEEEGYKAVIPKFPGMLVVADDVKTLHEMVLEGIKVSIKCRQKEGRPVPEPDIKNEFNGKVLVRMKPEIHEKLFYQAKANNVSLNKYIENQLSSIV